MTDISGLLMVSTGCLGEFNRIVSVLLVLLSIMIRAVLYLGGFLRGENLILLSDVPVVG